MYFCCLLILIIIWVDPSSLPPFAWSEVETKSFEISSTRKKSLFEGEPFGWFMLPLGKSFVPLIWQLLLYTVGKIISKQDVKPKEKRTFQKVFWWGRASNIAQIEAFPFWVWESVLRWWRASNIAAWGSSYCGGGSVNTGETVFFGENEILGRGNCILLERKWMFWGWRKDWKGM